MFYDKPDEFDFRLVNFPYICSNIPKSPAYVVYISQLTRYDRACSPYGDFIERGRLLTTHSIMFYDRYNDLLQHYNTPLSHLCVTYSPLLRCVTYTRYNWLYSWFHGGCVVDHSRSSRKPIHILRFYRGSVLSWVGHFFPSLLLLWTNGFRSTDDRQTDSYFHSYT